MYKRQSLDGLEETGHLYSAQVDWEMTKDTIQNLAAFYTEDRLADWETYDSAGADQLRDALDSGMASAILLGLDGIPLNTITQDGCIMAGSYDAQESVSYTHLDVYKRQACADPRRRAHRKSGFQKRSERARPSEAFRGNLAPDAHHDHA